MNANVYEQSVCNARLRRAKADERFVGSYAFPNFNSENFARIASPLGRKLPTAKPPPPGGGKAFTYIFSMLFTYLTFFVHRLISIKPRKT